MTTPSPLPEIHLSNLAYTVSHWLPRTYAGHMEDPFDLEAPYQRGSVWSVTQRQNLIKSLLMGLPVGNIVIASLPYKADVAPYRIVDGKQRVEAIRAFVNDEFGVPAWWFPTEDLADPTMRDVPDAVALYWQLSERGRRGFENAQMGALEFKPGTEVTPNPNFDPTLTDKYHKPIKGHENDPNRQRFLFRKRSDEEIIQAEAELYLLINFGGVAQTEDDRARAASFTGEQA